LATAIGEAAPGAGQRVERHIATCASCRREFENYRAVDSAVSALREAPFATGHAAEARARLESQLADLRRRLLAYRIFPSPLGHILIAQSELGIALVEYLEGARSLRASRLSHESGVELVEGGGEIETAYRELLEYLQGRRKRLTWPLDLRLARSDFQRMTLQATAAIPYGAVVPYAAIAQEIGRAPAVRAVAQALRWNPLPIVIPCHRVIGTSGSLTGYAGGKVDLKHKLLSVEGIPIAKSAASWASPARRCTSCIRGITNTACRRAPPWTRGNPCLSRASLRGSTPRRLASLPARPVGRTSIRFPVSFALFTPSSLRGHRG